MKLRRPIVPIFCASLIPENLRNTAAVSALVLEHEKPIEHTDAVTTPIPFDPPQRRASGICIYQDCLIRTLSLRWRAAVATDPATHYTSELSQRSSEILAISLERQSSQNYVSHAARVRSHGSIHNKRDHSGLDWRIAPALIAHNVSNSVHPTHRSHQRVDISHLGVGYCGVASYLLALATPWRPQYRAKSHRFHLQP